MPTPPAWSPKPDATTTAQSVPAPGTVRACDARGVALIALRPLRIARRVRQCRERPRGALAAVPRAYAAGVVREHVAPVFRSLPQARTGAASGLNQPIT